MELTNGGYLPRGKYLSLGTDTDREGVGIIVLVLN